MNRLTQSFLLIMASTIFTSGCSFTKEIPYTDLGQVGRPIAGIEYIKTPEEFDLLWDSMLGQRTKPMINWEREVLFGVFWGVKPTGGYSLKVTGVRLKDNEVIIEVELVEPKPTDYVIMILTYPGNLISVPKDKLPITQELKVKVETKGEEILFEENFGDIV